MLQYICFWFFNVGSFNTYCCLSNDFELCVRPSWQSLWRQCCAEEDPLLNTLALTSLQFSSTCSEITQPQPRACSTPSTIFFLPLSTAKQKKQQNVDLIHFDFIVSWNYLCSFASSSHKYIHTKLSDTKAEIHTCNHTVAFLNIPYSAIGWKIESISNSKVRCVLI